jgi:hypothetical protein
VQAGHRVAFATAAEWVDRLTLARGAGRLHDELRGLARYPLLVVDEVGYSPSTPTPPTCSSSWCRRANCRFDGNATFNYQFVLSQVSGWDYFHPNQSGQTTLASVTYGAGFNW